VLVPLLRQRGPQLRVGRRPARQRRAVRPQAGQDERQIAAGGVGDAGHDVAVGDRAQHREDDGEVGRVHVRPHDAGLLAPADEVPDRPGDQVVQLLAEPLGTVVGGKHVDQAAVGRHLVKRLPEELGQAGQRVLDRGRRFGHRHRPVERGLQERPGQLVLAVEVPVGGGDVDARVPGDVIEGGVEPAGGEDLLGRVDEALPVAGGVGPQSARLGGGAGFHSLTPRRRRSLGPPP
jgi:hypothetical protein